MFIAAPIVIQSTTGVDWAAITAAISTGVAAVAGISATLWLATRSREYEYERARKSEEQRVYTACLTVFNLSWMASDYRRSLGPEQDERMETAIREHNESIIAAMNAYNELSLIGSEKVINAAWKVLQQLYKKGPENFAVFDNSLKDLSVTMRNELEGRRR